MSVLYGQTDDVITRLVPRVFDLQAAFSTTFLDSVVAGSQPKPVVWAEGNFGVEANPVGGPSITLARVGGRPSTALLIQRWTFSVNSGPAEVLDAILEVSFDVRTKWPKVAATATRRVTFADTNGRPVDPFRRLPVAGGIRRRAWSAIQDAGVENLASVAFDIPSPPEFALATAGVDAIGCAPLRNRANLGSFVRRPYFPTRKGMYCRSAGLGGRRL